MHKKLIIPHIIHLLFLLLFIVQNNAFGQIGIGNVLPDTVNSILDLRNVNNKSLRSPNAPGFYPSTPSGLLYFVNAEEKIFYNETSLGNYNGLTPWRFKFGTDTTSNTYITSGNLGIGRSDPQQPLHINASSSPQLLLEGTNSGYIKLYNSTSNVSGTIGYVSSSMFTISNSKLGGKISIDVNNAGKFNVNARISENGKQVVPTGTIILWYGSNSNVPGGWALCDGGTYQKMNGSGTIVTPNLVGKFPIGAGDDYNLGGGGGSATVTLTSVNQMPEHRHDVSNYTTELDGEHWHSFPADGGSTHSSGNTFRRDDGYNGTGTTSGPRGSNVNSSGKHTHNVTGNTGLTGDSTPIDNLPEYMTIRYIMKL